MKLVIWNNHALGRSPPIGRTHDHTSGKRQARRL
jgi:hypothetical protein